MIKIECTGTAQDLKEKIFQVIHNEKFFLPWMIDEENDITSTLEDYRKRAWLRLIVKDEEPDVLYIGIIKSREYELYIATYSYYMTKFMDYLIQYHTNDIKMISVSTGLVDGVDIYKETNG